MTRTAVRLSVLALLAQTTRGAALLAGGGVVTTLPPTATRATSGLQMTIDTRWVESNGYRPIRVHLAVSPPGPARADRSIEVELRTNGCTGSNFDVAVRTVIELPQGGTGVTLTVSAPQWQPCERFSVEAWEAGKRLDDLCAEDILVGRSSPSVGHHEGLPAILVVDRGAPTWRQRPAPFSAISPPIGQMPDLRELAKFLATFAQPNQQNVGKSLGGGTTTVLQVLDMMPNLEVLHPTDLPDRWLDFTCFDIVFISFSDLAALASQHPGSWRAIRDWAALGPTLCVCDAGGHFERLEELEQLLELRQLVDDKDRRLAYRGWTAPKPEHYRKKVSAFEAAARTLRSSSSGAGESQAEDAALGMRGGGPPAAPSPPTFVFRHLNLGHVVAFAPKQVFPGDPHLWGWFFNSLPERHWMWYQRHGVSLRRPNDDYWNFLIPGVGLAPVRSFLVLILVFAVVIGPVNYCLLRRARRLHLFLVTVPIGAAVVVLGLFGWALVKDGLGVRVRARSFTEIDQRTGRAVSWSRQSYYAGLVPSGGFSFPIDTAVYPLEHAPQWGPERRLVWDERQRYTAGYMRSRVTTQFIAARTSRTRAALSVTWPEGRQSPPQIENRLGTRILQLVVRDEAGRDYWAEGVDKGAAVRPQPADPSAASERLRQELANNRPADPPQFDPSDYQRSFGMGLGLRHSYSYWEYGDQWLSEPSTEDGILETSLRGVGAMGIQSLPRGGYVAIVESCDEVPLGIERAREEASLHVIQGRW